MKDVITVDGFEIYLVWNLAFAFRGTRLKHIAFVGFEDTAQQRPYRTADGRRRWRAKAVN